MIKIHSVPNHPSFDTLHHRLVNALVYHHKNLWMTPLEVTPRLKKLQKMAPGHAGVSNLLLLLLLFVSSKKNPPIPQKIPRYPPPLPLSGLQLGASSRVCPTSWKHSHIPNYIKIQGTPTTIVPNQPHIPYIRTLWEDQATQLHRKFNQYNLIPLHQAWFRPGVNMYDQPLRVASCLQRNNSIHQPTFLALMDVHKAFDMVLHNGLRAKLLNLRLHPTIIKWIYHFIHDRTAQVRLKSTLSTNFVLQAGVPQRAAISPLLCYIYFMSGTSLAGFWEAPQTLPGELLISPMTQHSACV